MNKKKDEEEKGKRKKKKKKRWYTVITNIAYMKRNSPCLEVPRFCRISTTSTLAPSANTLKNDVIKWRQWKPAVCV